MRAPHSTAFAIISVLIFLASASAAQEAPTPTVTPPIVRSRDFSFTNTDTTQSKQSTVFCLPRTEQLVKVLNVVTQQSNSASQVHVTGDTAANCINIDVTMPPIFHACTNIPSPTLLNPGRQHQFCEPGAPNALNFSVQYQITPSTAEPKP
jgi:hypothetical protein